MWQDLESHHRNHALVLAIGNFDGVHLGHQALLAAAMESARPAAVKTAALVPDPHPLRTLAPGKEPCLLTPMGERARLLRDFGIDELLRLPFDERTASLSAESFVANLLRHLDVREVVVGANFRFGHGAAASAEELRALLTPHDVAVTIVPMVMVREQPVSASRVRRDLGRGELLAVRELLGRPFTVRGRVLRGDQRGRELGFPTANVELDGARCLPPHGVYSALVRRGDDVYAAAANLGLRPTVDGQRLTLEAHLLDFSGSLYDEELDVSFERFVRPEERFSSLDALKEQIARDVQAIRSQRRPEGR